MVKLSLNQKVFFSTSSVICVLVVATLLWLNGSLKDTMSEKISADLQRGKKTFEAFFEERFESLFLNARIVADSPQFKSVIGLPEVDHETVLFTLQEMHRIVGSDILTVTDSRGVVLARIEAPSESGQDISKEADIAAALKGQEYASLVAGTGKLYQVVTLPIIAEGVIQGALRLGFWVDARVAGWIHELTGSHIAFFAGGDLVAFSGSEHEQRQFDYLEVRYRDLLRRVQAEGQTLGPLSLELLDETHLAILAPLKGKVGVLEVVYVLEMSLTEALAFYHQRVQWILILIGLLAIGLSIFPSYLLAQGIAQPILRLARVAEGVAKGDLSTRVSVSSGDEVEILADSFNHMVDDLTKARDELVTSKDYTDNIITSMVDTLLVVDRHSRIKTVNAAIARLLGYREAELVGKPVDLIFAGAEVSAFKRTMMRQLLVKGETRDFEMTFRTKLGERIPVSFNGSVLRDNDGKIVGVLGIARDMRAIKDLVQKEKELAAAATATAALEKQHAQELAAAHAQLAGYSRELEQKVAERTGELANANEKLTRRVDEVQERNREINILSEMDDVLQACHTPAEAYGVFGQFAQELFRNESGALGVLEPAGRLVNVVARWGPTPPQETTFPSEQCFALRRGRMHVVGEGREALYCQHVQTPPIGVAMCIPLMAHGEALGVVYLTLPDPELRAERVPVAGTMARHLSLALANLKLRETLRDQSIHDALTGLFNRRYLEEALRQEIVRAQRGQLPLSIIMFDVDHFKKVNDTFGHEAGDALLRAVADFLRQGVREVDIPCRYGGEEFTLILPNMNVKDALDRAERLREGFKRCAVHHDGRPLGRVTVSLGVAAFPDHGTTGDEVLQSADAALYRAKEAGRDRVIGAAAA